jgi:probable phosphoglycerate mutase
MSNVTTVLLVRHGATDWIGRAVAGHTPDIHLNDEGCRQADQVCTRLAALPIRAVYTSPLERARETAAPLAAALGIPLTTCDEAIEIGFGIWTGVAFSALQADDRWRRFNLWRSFTRAPSGELMLDVQLRIVRAIERIRENHPGEAIALFSHGDVIRAAVTYFAGIPLDLFQRIEIQPASVSTLRFYDDSVVILGVNDTGTLYT